MAQILLHGTLHATIFEIDRLRGTGGGNIFSKDTMVDGNNAQRDTPMPKEHPALDIPLDVQRSREETMIPAEWLVLFRGAQPGMYNGVPHPTSLDSWIEQTKRILEASRVPRDLWVPFATIQLEGEASRWWSSLQADSHSMSWSIFVGALRDAFGLPPDPYVPEFDLKEDDLEEDPEENQKEDVEGNEHAEDQVMVDAKEQEILEPTEDELHTQRWERFEATVKAWEPIPDENLEDYVFRFFSTFFGMENLPEELEVADLCKIFWLGVSEPIWIHGKSCEDSVDAQLDNARRE